MEREITLSIGGIVIRMASSVPLRCSEALSAFRVEAPNPDYVLTITETETLPELPKEKRGEDLIQDYYVEGDFHYAVGKPGSAGHIVVTKYLLDFSRMMMYIKKDRAPGLFGSFDKALQLFPIRELLAQNGAMLLHASQISVAGRGILFSAPSGTGKSTQARLWYEHQGAEILCNDRTLLRKGEAGYMAYGYPVDGSSPVHSQAATPVGAVVVLRQAAENRVERLPPLKATKYLMEQTVADVWNRQEQAEILRLWLDFLEHCPVYCLFCRADGEAVECLKHQLENDKVI